MSRTDGPGPEHVSICYTRGYLVMYCGADVVARGVHEET